MDYRTKPPHPLTDFMLTVFHTDYEQRFLVFSELTSMFGICQADEKRYLFRACLSRERFHRRGDLELIHADDALAFGAGVVFGLSHDDPRLDRYIHLLNVLGETRESLAARGKQNFMGPKAGTSARR